MLSFCDGHGLVICVRGTGRARAPVLLAFGKVAKDRFSLDFGSPFTPASAIFVALSTFANKLAVA